MMLDDTGELFLVASGVNVELRVQKNHMADKDEMANKELNS